MVPCITEEIDCSVRDLPDRSPPPGRDLPSRSLFLTRPTEPLNSLRGRNPAWSDHIRRDAERAVLDADRCGERVDSSFGRRDVGLQRHSCVGERRGYKDDPTTCGAECGVRWGFQRRGIGVGGFEEVGEDGFQGVEGAQEVDVDHGFEGVG